MHHVYARRDLPRTPNEKYTQDFIDECDKYRDSYKSVLGLVDKIENKEAGCLPPGKRVCYKLYDTENINLLKSDDSILKDANKECFRWLRKYHCFSEEWTLVSTGGCNITALYIPDTVKKISVAIYFREESPDHWTRSLAYESSINLEKTEPLETLLERDSIIPSSRDHIETILAASRHNINIDISPLSEKVILEDKAYRRVVPVHPFLPRGITMKAKISYPGGLFVMYQEQVVFSRALKSSFLTPTKEFIKHDSDYEEVPSVPVLFLDGSDASLFVIKHMWEKIPYCICDYDIHENSKNFTEDPVPTRDLQDIENLKILEVNKVRSLINKEKEPYVF